MRRRDFMAAVAAVVFGAGAAKAQAPGKFGGEVLPFSRGSKVVRKQILHCCYAVDLDALERHGSEVVAFNISRSAEYAGCHLRGRLLQIWVREDAAVLPGKQQLCIRVGRTPESVGLGQPFPAGVVGGWQHPSTDGSVDAGVYVRWWMWATPAE